jgi:hypothetical protein
MSTEPEQKRPPNLSKTRFSTLKTSIIRRVGKI